MILRSRVYRINLFSISTGVLMNKIGRKKTVILSNVITILAMSISLIQYTFVMSLMALCIANTILQVLLNPLLTNVVQGDKLTSNLTAGQFVQARPDKANEISGLMITGVFGGFVILLIMDLTSDAIGSQVGSVLTLLLNAFYLLFCAFAIKTKN